MNERREIPNKNINQAEILFKTYIENSIDEANKGITHADFVTGMQNKTIGFKCMLGEPYQFVKGIRKAIFNILVLLYTAGPLIIIPLWAYHESNWWLLFGIVISWVSSGITAKSMAQKGKTVGGILLFLCVVFWVFKGVHNYFTFFSLSLLWGCMLFQMAEEAQREYAAQSLIESPELFNAAIAHNKIMIIRRDDKA